MLLIGNGRLITQNPETPFIEDGCVAVSGCEIAAVGSTDELRKKYSDAEFYSADNNIIMPGLICAHTHIYSAFARGLSLPGNENNKTFTDILKNQWWRIDKVLNEEDNLYSAYSTGLESVRNGVTTIFDHHASQNHVTGSLFAISKALSHIGLRSSLCYEVSERDGEDIADKAIEENISYIKHTENDDTDMCKAMFGLHASFTLSDDLLEKCTGAMAGKNTGYHIHVAEGIEDLYDSLQKYGKRIVHRLFDAGILGHKTLAVHCVNINNAEMDMLKSTDTMAVHNPESNMGNAVGCTPALQMLQKGILLGLGTDAYTQDMFESLKVANLIHKHHLCNPSVGFADSLQMLFENNSKICSRFFKKPLGIIKQGAYADIIVVDYTPHTPLNKNTLGGHIMFGLMGRSVISTIINGRFVMKNREMQNLDEKQTLAKASAQCQNFWQRLSN